MEQLLNHSKCKKWAIILSFFIMFTFISGCKNANLPSDVSKPTPSPPVQTQKPVETKAPIATEAVPTPAPTPMQDILKPEDVIVEIKEIEDNVVGGIFTYYESELDGLRKYGANKNAGSKKDFQTFVVACDMRVYWEKPILSCDQNGRVTCIMPLKAILINYLCRCFETR